MVHVAEVVQAKAVHKVALLSKPNVVGVGVGYKVSKGRRGRELCVVALVRRKMPPTALTSDALVPRAVNGISTDVIEVGEIRALQAPTDRWRPAPGGVSIGHHRITAGTLGCVVRDRASGARLILSNNHVLANSNNASPGDAILQPGPVDGGVLGQDTIAQLERFQPIRFLSEPGTCSIAATFAAMANFLAALLGSTHRLETIRADPSAANAIDAALARPLNEADLRDDILRIGEVAGTLEAELGMKVRKSGRTSGFTQGEIILLDATVDVSYDLGRTARFEGQIVAGPMSQGGDSGSLVVSGEPPQAVGLLFAGSDRSTILNPIQAVLDTLDIRFA